MGVSRDDLLLMTRALRRSIADVKAIRKGLDRLVSKPIGLLQSLHLSASDAETLRADATMPDPVRERASLDALHAMLLEGDYLSNAEWDKFLVSITRPTVRKHAALPVSQEFDGYTLQWELARREQGVVYRAKARDGREVAIKIFRPEIPMRGELPKVGGLPYAVSDFVDGESLEAKRPSPKRGAHAVWKAAEQLRERAHGALSPARIVIRKDDSVAVLGFECAKAAPLSEHAQAYAGPSDAHALGAILYEVLVGAPPAGERSPAERLRDVDPGLDRIVSCALTGGYATTGALADDLGHYFKGEPITGRKAPSPSAAGGRGKPWIWIAAAAAAAIAVAGLALRPRAPEPGAAAPDPGPAPALVHDVPPAPAKPKPLVQAPAPAPAAPAKPLTADEEQKLSDRCVDAQGKGDGELVLSTANEAIARGTKRDWPYYQLSLLFLSRNELDKALEYVSRALELSPKNRDSLEIRAQTYAFRGEAKKALEDLDALYGKKVSDLNRQIVLLSKQAEADAKDARTRLLRGVFFLVKRNYETAATDFTAAFDGGLHRSLAWRALAFKGADDPGRAAADARAYLAEFPNDFATEEVKTLLKSISTGQ